MKLVYHVSDNTNELIEEFTLRVPERKMGAENQDLPRICVAESLQNCLAAHPTIPFLTNPDDLYYLHQYSKTSLRLNKRGIILRLYGFYLEDDKVITPSKDYVPDVEETNERWVLEDIKPDLSKILMLHGYDKETKTFHYSIFNKFEDISPIIPCEFIAHCEIDDKYYYDVEYYDEDISKVLLERYEEHKRVHCA